MGGGTAMRKVGAKYLAIVIGLGLLFGSPVASSTSFKIASGNEVISGDVDEGDANLPSNPPWEIVAGGHYTTATADADKRSLPNSCDIDMEYSAEAGPLLVDPGGQYTAHGDGDFLADKSQATVYPVPASVSDSNRVNVATGYGTATVEATATADSIATSYIQSTEEDSVTC